MKRVYSAYRAKHTLPFLAFSASAWVLERIHNGMQTKKDHKYLKKLVYLLYLMRFFTLRDFQIQKALDKEDEADNSNDNNEEGGEVADVNPDRLLKVFGFAPRPVVEGFIRRFVEIVEVDGRKM